jgi:hypothetical protein
VALCAACDTSSSPNPSPVSPTPPLVTADYTGTWRGGWRVERCDDVTAARYCAANLHKDFEPIALQLTQSGRVVTGQLQSSVGGGAVAGSVDDLGRLRLSGSLIVVDGHGVSATIVDWRMVAGGDQLIGAFKLNHFAGPIVAFTTVNETVGIQRCQQPTKFIGVYWEC